MLDVLLEEIVVERAIAAREIADGPVKRWLDERRPSIGGPPTLVPHKELKQLVGSASLVVRTGQDTRHANLILSCGVAF